MDIQAEVNQVVNDLEDCTCEFIPDEAYLEEGAFPLCASCQRLYDKGGEHR